MTAAELDRLPEGEAAEAFRACCGATRWVSGMLSARPFGTVQRVRDAARRVWEGLDSSDWREAFAHHPRIGESGSERPQEARGRVWSTTEQSGVSAGTREVRDALARMNQTYEQRFGIIYLVCAAGRSAQELLTIGRERLGHDAETELRIAAAEQLKITLLRLDRLLAEGG